MPQLTRNGVVIHWEAQGEGPGLFIAHSTVSMPSSFDALLGQLASDHHVVTWDPRGTGESSRRGPFDIATDAEDMAAVIEESGRPVVAVTLGYNPVPLAVATTRPELVDALVLVGGLPQLGSPEGAEDVALYESDAVLEVIREMLESNPQGLLRTFITLGNPQMSEAEVRERIEEQLAYSPPEVGVERAKSYLDFDATHRCAALGRRLWIIHWENPIGSSDAIKRAGRRLPEAQLFEVEDGPISRPDLTAEIVRQAAASLRGRA
jgi:pimeloyl-ACP methyl ester carboxylesterase